MHYLELDTPALLVDKNIMENNIKKMMEKARKAGVRLRPHIKTHRTPDVAKIQINEGASGITAAKVAEAEVMVSHGLTDVFIANEIYGDTKLLRLRNIHKRAKIAIGVDNKEQIQRLHCLFKDEEKPLDVLIEIDTGEARAGVSSYMEAYKLAKEICISSALRLRGIFSHEGHAYGANSIQECRDISIASQEQTIECARFLRDKCIPVEEISIGSTPSLLHGEIVQGITEIRPGTYVFMDAAQGAALKDYSNCALTVLATVVSKPAPNRVVLDSGVKALTAFTRTKGLCYTAGYGLVKGYKELWLNKLYDEHGMIINEYAYRNLSIGDKIEIIPNHACPTCNLYDSLYVVDKQTIYKELPISCRGKSQ